MTWAEGGMLSCPQTGGLWFVMAVKYILSQVLPGSHIGLSPGGVSKLVLLKTSSSRASAVNLTAFIHVVALQKARVWASHSCSRSMCTLLGGTHMILEWQCQVMFVIVPSRPRWT